MKDNKPSIPDEVLINKIILVRGKKVMIDADLAELYGVTTKRLNEQVKRNHTRFPDDFMFRLTIDEKNWVVANCDHLQNLKFSSSLPYVFTEYGTVMLASVLKTERAISVNIQVVRVFIKLREMLVENTDLRMEIDKIKRKQINHDKNIELLFSYLDEFIDKQDNPQPRKLIGYKRDKE
jgi:hypothetical protein